MNADELRTLQAPFKARYRADPTAAQLRMFASAELLGDRPACRVENRWGPIVAGLHPAAGGDERDACSVEMLLQAMAACAGVTFNLVATAMSLPFKSVKVVVESDGDFRGALGIARDVPVGMSTLRLRFEVDSSATDEQLTTVLKQTERYCMVLQTIKNPPPIEVSLERMGPAQ
jgi:uncharacterized OsmC-like protein